MRARIHMPRALHEAIHHYFCSVGIESTELEDSYIVVLPHLVTHKPDEPETMAVEWQQHEVEADVQAIIRRAGLPGVTYTIQPNGQTEGANKHWYQFRVVLTIPKQEAAR